VQRTDLLLDRTLHSYNLTALGALQIFESHHITLAARKHDDAASQLDFRMELLVPH